MVKTVTASFSDSDDAEKAARALRSAGFLASDVNVVTGTARGRVVHGTTESASAERATAAAMGVLAGGALGAVIGLCVTLLELDVPAIASVLAAGKLAPVLFGAGAGAIAGGLIGGLVDFGKAKGTAAPDTAAVRPAAALLAVRADASRVDEAEQIMMLHGAFDIEDHVQHWSGSG